MTIWWQWTFSKAGEKTTKYERVKDLGGVLPTKSAPALGPASTLRSQPVKQYEETYYLPPDTFLLKS